MSRPNLQNKAATIIQRNFRKYLNQKHELLIAETSSKTDNPRLENSSKGKVKYSKEVWKVRSGLESFYKKILEDPDGCRYVNDLIKETDKISNRLKQVKSLDTFQGKRKECSEDDRILIEAKRRHEEKLKQLQLQWWEKLNLSDSNY